MKIYDIIPTFAYRPEFRHLTGVAAGAVATAVGAAVGAIGASAISSSAARKSTKETNATNLELAQETNKTNTENVKATKIGRERLPIDDAFEVQEKQPTYHFHGTYHT